MAQTSTAPEPSRRPPEPTFVGDVAIDGYFRRASPSRLVGATVTFAPGARTPWKQNPLGQTLVVTAGTGWAQIEGGDVVGIRAGDIAWFPPGVRHWDGATPDEAMTCVVLHEAADGVGVTFGNEVSDAEYRRGSSKG